MIHTYYQRTLLPTQLIPHLLGLVIASILTGCAYQLPPVQPLNHSFVRSHAFVAPHRSLRYDKLELFYDKALLRLWEVPLRNAVLKRVVREGSQRYSKAVRLAAMDVLAARGVASSTPDILSWQKERRYNDIIHQYQLARIAPKQYPPQAMLDSIRLGVYRGSDTLEVARFLGRLGDPTLFSTVRKVALQGKIGDRMTAIRDLWYFWPFQGKQLPTGEVIDLYPVLEQGLQDTLIQNFQAIISQYEYAPRSPILKAYLVSYLATTTDPFRRQLCLKALVYRYHRKEKGYSKDMRSYWSRRKRTYME